MFYDTFLSYIEKWDYHFDKLKICQWFKLINCPTWNEVHQSIHFLMEKNKNNIGGKLNKYDFVLNLSCNKYF